MEYFGLREFQLYILAFMSYSNHVQEVLDRLDATWDDAKAVLTASNQTGLGKMHHKVDVEISMIGAPAYEEDLSAAETFGVERFIGSRVYGFHLPAFPDLDYLVNVARLGDAWGQRLGRRPDATAPRIDAFEDLQPWGAVKSEALDVLDDAKKIDEFSYYELYEGRIRERRTGELIEVLVEFDVELLQWAIPASEATER